MKNLGEIVYNQERMSWEKGVEANGFVFLSGVLEPCFLRLTVESAK